MLFAAVAVLLIAPSLFVVALFNLAGPSTRAVLAGDDRDYVTRTVQESDFLLFPEYWLLEEPYVRRLVDADYRTLESYPNGVVLLQNKRLDEPARRRSRS